MDAFEKSARLVLELYGDNVNDVNYLKSIQSNSSNNQGNLRESLREGVGTFLKNFMHLPS